MAQKPPDTTSRLPRIAENPTAGGDGRGPAALTWSAPPQGRVERGMRMLRNRRWVILALVLLGVGLAAVWSITRGDRFEATTTLVLEDDAAVVEGARGDAEREASTSRGLLTLPVISRDAAARIGGGIAAGEISEAVEVEEREGADLVDIHAEAGSAAQAPRIANAYADAYIGFRRSAERRKLDRAVAALNRSIAARQQGGGAGDGGEAPGVGALRERRERLVVARSLESGDARVVQPAEAAEEVSVASLPRDLVIGLLAGLLLGTLLAWLLERVDRRLKSIEELEELYGLPVLARVPQSRSFSRRGRKGREEAISKTLGFSEEAESFRALRANLRYFNVDSRIGSVLVVSPLSGDGKSTVARFLAITMASMGDSVVLVNADLRKTDADSPEAEDGLSLVLAGFDLDGALTEAPISFDAVSQEPRMLVELPSGPLPPNPSELLESERMRWVIRELESKFDMVIIDSPALTTVSDALSLVPAVSGTLIVSGLDHTTRRAALDLRRQLALLQGRPLGLVANFWTSQKSEYYYGYGERKQRRDRTPA